MLLTKHVDDFNRLPKVELAGGMGFKEQYIYCIQNGFVSYTNPHGGVYEASQVTRLYGRTNIALVPIDAGYVSVADDYIVALSRCQTMLWLYYHKDRREKYCEVHDSLDTDFIQTLFDWYRICCGRIREERINLGGVL